MVRMVTSAARDPGIPATHTADPSGGGGCISPNSQLSTNLDNDQTSEFVALSSRKSDNDLDDDMDMELEDMCEVVMSFKCRHCSFLCQDKPTLASHVKSRHHPNNQKKLLTNGGSKGNKGERHFEVLDGEGLEFSGLETSKREIGKEELPSVPSIPPTPEAFLVDDEDGDQYQSQIDNLGVEGEVQNEFQTSKGPSASLSASAEDSDVEIHNVFLCAECDIVFASKELCCSHMHQVHDLMQFSADFIQEEIISKNPCQTPATEIEDTPLPPRRRKVNPPKHLTLEGGAVVPKRFRVTKDIFFTCSKCPKKFESNEIMKIHEQCHPKEGDEGVPSSCDGQDSIQRSKGGFLCPLCKPSIRFFAKWSFCAGHLWREHQIDCELYSCSVCKKFKTSFITKVREHEQIHSHEAVYVCKICRKKFKQRHQLICHEKYHKEKKTRLPPPTDSRWYTPKECHICNRILSDAKCLKKHISAVHNKLKPYCCNICGHMTARKAELQLHVRQHTGEKPFTCGICPFVTGDHNSLRKHKLRHSDKRPYSCPYCLYKCIQSSAFKKHIVSVHPGQEVVFLCQLCSHASVNETHFAAHQKDHAEGRLPSCDSRNQPDSPGGQDSRSSDSVSNSESGPKRKTPEKPRWLEEDSVDVIDTGGVTIPASPTGDPNPFAAAITNTNQNGLVAPTQNGVVNENHGSTEGSQNLTDMEILPHSLQTISSIEEQNIVVAENGSPNLTTSSPELTTNNLISRGLSVSATSTISASTSLSLVTPSAPSQTVDYPSTHSLGTTTTYILLPPNTRLPYIPTTQPSVNTNPVVDPNTTGLMSMDTEATTDNITAQHQLREISQETTRDKSNDIHELQPLLSLESDSDSSAVFLPVTAVADISSNTTTISMSMLEKFLGITPQI